MSLLECICCSGHRHRTAVTWDDPSQGQTCFHTYSHLLHVAGRVTSALATLPALRSPVAIYGRNCPSVLAAVLGVMSLTREPLESGESPGVGGVACFPLALDEVPADQERSLQQCKVQVVLVEGTVINVRAYIAKVSANPPPPPPTKDVSMPPCDRLSAQVRVITLYYRMWAQS